jgi:hypothetical protein
MDSYHKFTSHLQAKLADIDQTNLIFGSDEEFAAVKAVHLSFPNATRVRRLDLCAGNNCVQVSYETLSTAACFDKTYLPLSNSAPLTSRVWSC